MSAPQDTDLLVTQARALLPHDPVHALSLALTAVALSPRWLPPRILAVHAYVSIPTPPPPLGVGGALPFALEHLHRARSLTLASDPHHPDLVRLTDDVARETQRRCEGWAYQAVGGVRCLAVGPGAKVVLVGDLAGHVSVAARVGNMEKKGEEEKGEREGAGRPQGEVQVMWPSVHADKVTSSTLVVVPPLSDGAEGEEEGEE